LVRRVSKGVFSRNRFQDLLSPHVPSYPKFVSGFSVARMSASLLMPLQISHSGQNDTHDTTTAVEQACLLCRKYPIVVPYETDACRHLFCYTCLWEASSAKQRPGSLMRRSNSKQHQENASKRIGTGYPCPTCRKLIRASRPVPLHRYQIS